MANYKELIERLNDISKALGFESTSCVCLAAEAIERLEKERDAAIADLKVNWLCAVCKKRVVTKEWMACKNKDFYEAPCEAPTCLNFEWRGVQEYDNADDHG